MEFVRTADSLDGRDAGLIRNPAHFGDAGANHLAVQDYRTAPALPLTASDLGPRQFKLFPKRIGQKRIRIHHHHLHFPIDIQIFSNHADPPLYFGCIRIQSVRRLPDGDNLCPNHEIAVF